MNGLFAFMGSTWGRSLRALLGLALIYFGLVTVGGAAGIVVALVSLVPIVMGASGPCLLRMVVNRLHHT